MIVTYQAGAGTVLQFGVKTITFGVGFNSDQALLESSNDEAIRIPAESIIQINEQ